MENATLQVLSKCNITPKYKGYTYLPVAVRLADQYMREPLCIMADIYPVIGQIYDESPRKVERAIRKVVEVGWQNNREYKKRDAFVRVVQTTTEGDIIITDVLYDSKNDKIHIVTDNTRDKYSSKEDRTIKYQSYEKISVWFHNSAKYWVAYNGTLPEENINETDNENFFIITSLD